MDIGDKLVREKLFGETHTYCEAVNTGAKLTASMMVSKKSGRDEYVQRIVHKYSLNTLCFPCGEDFTTIYIYKYDYVRQLIVEKVTRERTRIENDPDSKPSILDVWTSGKLFGYSDHEIALFLENSGYATQ